MPFSHHSHSGQFCNHATDKLADVVSTAIAKKMSLYSLTEHVSRPWQDFYPGEAEAGFTPELLEQTYDAFVQEARRLRESMQNEDMEILIGFEAEWIRGEDSIRQVHGLMEKYREDLDFFVGSVHYVRGIPIDYDKGFYEKAKDACGGRDENIFTDYFDAQFDMLKALKPKVVGHFDLIRLMSAEPDRDWRTYENVWEKIKRNLNCVKEGGGMLELNTSALRKGLEEPYPRREICELWIEMGGDFVLSDDSHGISQIGTNYARALEFVKKVPFQRIAYLTRKDGITETRTMTLAELEKHPFWTTL